MVLHGHPIIAQSVSLPLSELRFRDAANSVMGQYLALGVVVVILAVVAVAVAFYVRRRRQLQELSLQREEARLHLALSELNVNDNDRELLETLAGSDSPRELLPLLEERRAFEEAVGAFRETNPRDPALRRVPRLRQRLHYGFNNIRNPFVDTRMLSPGIKMRCRLGSGKREVSFVTTVLAVTEHQLVVRPPNSHGKPATLPRVRSLQFRVSRDHDAEYAFNCRVIGQPDNEMKPVVVAHSTQISRLLFRNADRIPVELDKRLYVVRQEHTAEQRSLARLQAKDSQYVFEGQLRDLSIGGAMAVTDKDASHISEGDVVVFRLEEAQIKDDMVAQAVGVVQRDDGRTQIHLQLQGLKELNRLKLGKFLQNARQAAATAPAAASEGDTPQGPARPAG